eukprot:TRINITY_DN3311_c0_g1_i1.p1 TRINITY_DN3311_c0_g1~~TRINITY_DN3311_c0_g1_i1.p1  ORF type:complete len:239 (+),score=21.62 TRINITY_DN3311_c0_g1_i1:20-736(+)
MAHGTMLLVFVLTLIAASLGQDTCQIKGCTSGKLVSKPTLTYFNVAGRGEVIRLMLEDSGTDYDFDVVTRDTLAAKKEELADELLFKQVPLYREPSGFSLPQSAAIERYLARKLGYNGDDKTAALVDALAEGVVDIADRFRKARFAPEAEREAKKEEFFKNDLPVWYGHFESFIQKNKTPYLTGDRVSYADFRIFSLAVSSLERKGLENYPLLSELIQRIGDRPNVKKFVDSKPYEPK